MPDSPAARAAQASATTDAVFAIRATAFDSPAVGVMTDAVQDYYRSIYDGPDRAPVDIGEFTAPRGMFFVGSADGVPVAMGGWRWIDPVQGLPATQPVEVKRMYVDAAMRGRGYAKQLLQCLETTARDAGADAIVLSTGSPQVEAIGLYRSSGYDDVPRFGYYAAYPNAVHLGKILA